MYDILTLYDSFLVHKIAHISHCGIITKFCHMCSKITPVLLTLNSMGLFPPILQNKYTCDMARSVEKV